MVRWFAPDYPFAMVMMEQTQPADENKVVFRRLSPVAGYSGAATLRHSVYGPVPELDARALVRVLARPIHVPNWILAATVVATLGVSTALSTGLTTHPGRTLAPVTGQSVSLPPNPSSGWTGATVNAEAVVVPGSGGAGRLAILQGQITSMNADLQGIQRQNDALRNLSRQQSADLSSERSNLASSQDLLSGESQDLGERLATMRQELDGRVPGLQGAVNAAADVVNQIRKLLGMPQVTLPSG